VIPGWTPPGDLAAHHCERLVLVGQPGDWAKGDGEDRPLNDTPKRLPQEFHESPPPCPRRLPLARRLLGHALAEFLTTREDFRVGGGGEWVAVHRQNDLVAPERLVERVLDALTSAAREGVPA